MIRPINTIILGPSSLLREGVNFTICRTRYKTTAMAEAITGITSEAWSRHRPPSLTIILAGDFKSTLQSVRSLRELRPSECIVVLCESFGQDEQCILQAGASACISASISPDVLIMSLDLLSARDVAMAALAEQTGFTPVVREVCAPTVRDLPPDPVQSVGTRNLTRREIDVLQAVARGESNKRIANALSMREPTVKSHLRLILKKIGSHNRTQAATWAVEHGIADHAAKPFQAPSGSFPGGDDNTQISI